MLCLQVEELEEKLLDQTQEVERLRSELVRLEEPWEKLRQSHSYTVAHYSRITWKQTQNTDIVIT